MICHSISKTLAIYAFLFFLVIAGVRAQSVERVDPPNWWPGMQNQDLQLMLYGTELQNIEVESASRLIEIDSVHRVASGKYAFVFARILPDATPGMYKLLLKGNGRIVELEYPVLERAASTGRYSGFDARDVIYLITPDRFVNGDTTNDKIDGMRDIRGKNDILGRHGGDIQGIINKLDYIANLGATAIWINPLVENDMSISYHGYGVTNHYKIDPRFGSLELYRHLVDQAHKSGLKVIMDHVANHIGEWHPWMTDLPQSDWIHGTVESHISTSHNKSALFDPHAGVSDVQNLLEGWFVNEMPDLNQKNPLLARYLIQNTIWWIEMCGIDGIREDTYPYADPDFMSEWALAIRQEYPRFSIVGEVWIHDPVFIAPFQENSQVKVNRETHLPSVTDFGLLEAFGRVFLHGRSINELHGFLSRDFLYNNPNNLMIFLDNHDIMRLNDVVKGDTDRYIMALKLLLTLRGIPQIYYGTEIGLAGGPDHGEIRADFPGGFSGHQRNAFEPDGRSERESSIFNTLQHILHLRKSYPALALGKMIHFKPDNEIYAYLRISPEQKLMMIVNNKSGERSVNIDPYSDYFHDKKVLRELVYGDEYVIKPGQVVRVRGNDVAIFSIE